MKSINSSYPTPKGSNISIAMGGTHGKKDIDMIVYDP
jgi:hypothetical protein